MNKDYVRRTAFVRVGGFGSKRFAASNVGHHMPLAMVGANDSAESHKWPRPLRLAVALGFGASVWLAILIHLAM